MQLLCLLLSAAGSVFAGEPDINASDYWRRSYRIPQTYCERHISFETSDAAPIVAASRPCPFSSTGDGIRTQCLATREDSDRMVAALKKLDGLTGFSQNCPDAPENIELYHKRESLIREAGENGITLVTMPAIGSLLGAQFATLQALILAHENATMTHLTVQVVGQKLKAPPPEPLSPGKPLHRGISSIGLLGPIDSEKESWSRRERSACEQAEIITVKFEVGEEPAGRRRLDSIRRLGRDYVEPKCAAMSKSTLSGAFLIKLPMKEVRRRLMGMGGLVGWNVSPASSQEKIIPDDMRFDALSRDLLAHGPALKSAPNISSLVKAEIERVRANAERLRELRQGRLILVELRQP